jgi:hypothetical protein
VRSDSYAFGAAVANAINPPHPHQTIGTANLTERLIGIKQSAGECRSLANGRNLFCVLKLDDKTLDIRGDLLYQ